MMMTYIAIAKACKRKGHKSVDESALIVPISCLTGKKEEEMSNRRGKARGQVQC